MLQSVLFDFDGVCIDTETARYLSWQEIYASYGLSLPLDEWIKNIGKASYVSDPYPLLESLAGTKLDKQEILDRHRVSEIEITNAMPLMEGFAERLDEALSLGWRCAVVSSSSHRWVDGHLNFRKLAGKFTFTLCREDTVKHKPDPEPYVTAAIKLGVSPGTALVIEDSAPGVAAAKAAGCRCIAVPCPMTKEMDFSAADMMSTSLAGVSFAKIAGEW